MKPNPALDFKSLFETAPGLSLVVLPDFTIAAVTEGYLKATMTVREEIIGHDLFEIFPDNPNDNEADGVFNLRASLQHVLLHKEPHAMAVQKYDIRRPDGVFEERYWSPLNTPVLNQDKELVFIIHNVTDVTNQHNAEDKLKKSEQDFQLLVNNVKDYAIIMIDLRGCVASWNSGAESIHGYEKEEIIGRQMTIFYTADQLKTEAPKINLQKTLQHGHFETEDWQVRKDKSTFWANIVYTALRDDNGILYGYSKITRDITERKKAWDQVALLSRQINQSNDAIYTLDANLTIKSWNKGAENLYGFTEQEALGKNPNDLLKTDITDTSVSSALKKLISEDYWAGELKRVTQSGKPIYVNSSTTNIRNKEGIITGYVAVSIDITHQKKLGEAINHLATIVEQSSEAIFSIDRDYRIISWNGGAKKLFGFSKEDTIGKIASDIDVIKLSPVEIAVIENEICDKGIWKAEMDYYSNDGTCFFGAVTASAIKNEKGENNSFYFIIKDISLRKKAEEQLMQSNEALEEKVKARTNEIYKNEKRFRALIENNNDIISLMDEQFNVFYRSPSASRISGWSDKEIIGKDGTKNIHPDDLAYGKKIVHELIANPGKSIDVLFRNQHKDGHYLWVEGTVINLLQDESVNSILFNYRDITQRKKLEDLFNKANTLARIGSWEIDLLKETIYWTDMTREIHETAYDYQPDLESGINFYKEGKGRDLIKQKLKEAIESGTPWDVELQIITAKNNERWVRIIGETEFINGKCVKVYGSFQDINQRKKAEEKLIASEKHFRTLIENNNDLIILLDDAFKIIYRSPSAFRITGWSNEEICKADGTLKLHPDDQKQAAGIIHEIMSNPEKPVHFIFRNLHKEGHYLWMEATAVNLLHDENVNAIVLNSRDVTERITAEEKLALRESHFRSLIENISDAIVLNDEQSNILYQSPSVTRILGYNPKEREGKRVLDYIHPDDVKRFNELYADLRRSPNIPLPFQYRFLHKNNHYIWLEGVVTNLLQNPAVKAFVANYRDITERKEVEQKIISLNTELEERVKSRTEQLRKSNEELEAFSYSVSHDLRTPLRAIIGYTSILEEDYTSQLDDEAKRITSVIKNSTVKMGNLIDGLLSFSRMGRSEIMKVMIDQSLLVKEIIAGLEIKHANGKNIRWVINALPFIPAESNTIKQVWINLISNAVKYSANAAEPTIEIGSFKKEDQITFFIKDNGVGFDEKYKNKLFKVFQRLHTSNEFEGTGIGLAIVEKIISKYGGKVWVEAALNQGACFFFSVPDEQ